MTPFYFGTRDRRLFGVMDVPSPATRTRRAVVLCHPFGQEYVRAHRSMRKLAEQLCQQGFTVLRFGWEHLDCPDYVAGLVTDALRRASPYE